MLNKVIKSSRVYSLPDPLCVESNVERSYWLRFKAGDKDAYASLYNLYAALLFRYGRKIIHDRELVKDGIHDLFVELWKNRSTLGEPESVKNYLIKSLRRKLFRQIKNQKTVLLDKQAEENDTQIVFPHEFTLITNQLIKEQGQNLSKALNTLTKRQREIIFLLFYDDMKPTEVADIMSLTLRTVYNTTYNALQLLKKNIILSVMLLLLASEANFF